MVINPVDHHLADQNAQWLSGRLLTGLRERGLGPDGGIRIEVDASSLLRQGRGGGQQGKGQGQFQRAMAGSVLGPAGGEVDHG